MSLKTDAHQQDVIDQEAEGKKIARNEKQMRRTFNNDRMDQAAATEEKVRARKHRRLTKSNIVGTGGG